jgi:hypothetical protein
MSTLGQAFVLAQELASKGSRAHVGDATYASIDEALRMAPGAEQFYGDAAAVTGNSDTYFDIAPNAPKPQVQAMADDTYFDISPNAPGGGAADGGGELYMDIAPKPMGGGDVADVTAAFANMLGEESLYDTAAPESSQMLIDALNGNDLYMTTMAPTKIAMQQQEDDSNDTYMVLAPGEQQSVGGMSAQMPQWDAFDEGAVRNKVDLNALRAAQTDQNSTYLDINPNAP